MAAGWRAYAWGMSGIDIVSIHMAAAYLQATPRMIRSAAAKLGIEVDCRLNGVDCYLEKDLDRIAAYLVAHRGADSFPFNSFPTPLM
jgi:hypothetical protein